MSHFSYAVREKAVRDARKSQREKRPIPCPYTRKKKPLDPPVFGFQPPNDLDRQRAANLWRELYVAEGGL